MADKQVTASEYADSLERLIGADCPTPDKMRFSSKESASLWIRRKGRQHDNSLYPYRCKSSGHWHVTTRGTFKPPKQGLGKESK